MNGGRHWVIDASALLALLHDEPGAEAVEGALETGAVSTVNWSEVHHRLRAQGAAVHELRGDLEALGLEITAFTVEDAEEAARLWAATRGVGLSLGDRACLALGHRLELPVLTADRAWLDLDLDLDLDVRVESIR